MNQNLDKLRIDKESLVPKSGLGRRRIWVVSGFAGAILLIVAAVVFFKGRGISVETTTVSLVYPSQSFTLLNASGYVVAQRKAAVAAKITGRLEWLGVEEGSRVKAGDIVARLENRDLATSLDQAKASVQAAGATLGQAKAEETDATLSYNRQQAMFRQGIVAKADFDAAEARYRRAKAGVAAAVASLHVAEAAQRGAAVALDYSLIRAPFDAVVLTKNADIGDIITPLGAAANAKAAVVTIADLSSVQVEADVSESNLAQVKKEQPCEVTLDALPGVRLRAVVHTIVPTADRSKASVMVKVRFLDHDPRILPEMSAKVAFLSRPASKSDQLARTAIVSAAVAGQGRDTYVYRISNNIVRRIPVTVKQQLGDLVEVVGVKPGEKLVLRPLDTLHDGSRISVQKNEQ